MRQPTAEDMPSMSLRVGVDLVRVADVAGSLARFGDRYARRVFTELERAYCTTDADQAAERFAARFAAKEATIKVLRPSALDGITWTSIEVSRLAEGACEIRLHDAALALATRAGIAGFSMSMSHEQEYAMATVVGLVAANMTTEDVAPPEDVPAALHLGGRHGQTS